MKEIIDIPEIAYINTVNRCNTGLGSPQEKAIANGIPLPNNATNGDVIKAMFPNIKTWIVNKDMAVEFPEMLTIRLFPLVWWNAPYRRVENVD